MGSAPPLVSVGVPTSRRPKLLNRCLQALLTQKIPARTFEVIVADDANCEETHRQVADWATCAGKRGICLRYVPVRGAHGPAAARNAGWHAARGYLVAFTDDDCIPAPDWLSAGMAAFGTIACDEGARCSGERMDGVSGRIVVPLPETPSDYQRNTAQLAHAEFVTANCFYRRDALVAVGGFDERFAVAWREDSDLHFRLMERGARLTPARDAVVIHPARPAPWGVSVRQQRKSMYNALLYKKHPTLYRRYIQSAPPWRYYAIVAALVGMVLGGLMGHKRLTRIATPLWIGLTTEFCVRRLRGTSKAPSHVAEMVVTSLVIPLLAVFWRLRGALKFRVWFF